MEFQWRLGILLLLPIITLQFSSKSSLSYIGAVVEYHPTTQMINNEKPADLNAKNYVKFIKKASNYSADIIVFPESSLSTPTSRDPKIHRSEAASYIPDPKDKIIVCDNVTYTFSLRTISCAARDHQMYVVVNHHEKVDCLNNCPEDKLLIYNTNVAFDRQGRVIARYRKYNLFGEYEKNTTDNNVLSTFETDFGVIFGQFICFDILFPKPALNLTKLGIRDIIYSSHWFSELPYLYSVQAQSAWSYANDVNFLSAGYNNPLTVSGGSGIFMGRKGYSHVVMEPKAVNVLIVSEVPKVINGKRQLNMTKEKLYVHEFSNDEINTTSKVSSKPYVPLVNDLTIFTTKMIDLKKKSYDEILCDRQFCCNFKFDISFDNSIVKDNNNYYKYRLAVFNGTRTFSGVATGGIKTCGIISCTNDDLNSCGRLLNATIYPTIFHFINITIRNTSNDNVFFMPVSISNNLMPLNATDYTFDTYDFGNFSTHNMLLRKERSDLLTFAIFGRNFNNDGKDVTTNSSYSNVLSVFLIILTMLIYRCIN